MDKKAQSEQPNRFLGTCTGTKGSGAWMREWIELQLAVGVDHLWIADDNPKGSTDITTGVLQYYETLGYVTIIPRPNLTHPGCIQTKGPNGVHNCAPVKHCFEYASPHVKWLLFADTDEFIFPHNGCSVAEHIRNHCNPDATHIYLKWERFGSSGFDTHPNGMMLENLLTSGGTCKMKGCRNIPYTICPECRHSKVIYNTECAKLEHAGWIHWPVNTTDWKAGGIHEYDKWKWIQSPGPEAHWKKDTCHYTGFVEDTNKCNAWVTTGGGAQRPRKYTPDCCTGGIGYNHYGTKSKQFWVRKQANKNTFKRGWRTPFNSIDLNHVLSFSVLKFMRVLRKRFAGLGAQVSDNNAFVNLDGGRSCFVETNWRYQPTETTKARRGSSNTTKACCTECFNEHQCKAFTFNRDTCTLFISGNTVPLTSIKDNEYHLHVNRTWTFGYLSGIPMQQGECSIQRK